MSDQSTLRLGGKNFEQHVYFGYAEVEHESGAIVFVPCIFLRELTEAGNVVQELCFTCDKFVKTLGDARRAVDEIKNMMTDTLTNPASEQRVDEPFTPTGLDS